jgi:hypothetical protein
MKPLRHIAIAALIGMGISNVPSPATAAPNCPPQYQEICKQLIKVLEDNNDGKHFYQWDGTHLIISANFALYDSINHSSTDHRTGNVNATPKEYVLSKDYFPHLLSQMTAASQGGQRVYLHLFYGWGLDAYTVAGVSNTPAPPPTPMMVPSMAPNMVPQPAPQPVPGKIPQAVPQLQPVKTASKNLPKSVSVTHSVKSRSGQKIDKLNVNQHFATKTAGSLIESEERAYLFDSNDHVWSCKVSGLGARRMPSGDGNHQIQGHVETLQFRSVHLAHIPGNHPMHSGCLISVQQ